jgi:3-methylfumaryl-CoA hydratase
MSALRIQDITAGDSLPSRDFTPTNVSLFLYNAAIWNAHRIHYDEPYTTGVEKHPGIVVDGPLQGDWLTQTVNNWIGDSGHMESFQYSNRRASYLGETLTAGGTVKSVEVDAGLVTLELFIKNEAGEIMTPGGAVVRFTV